MTSCLKAGTLLERRQSGLDEAERLVLEEHLQTCSPCRQQAALLDAVRQSLTRPVPSRPAKLDSIVRRALDQGSLAQPKPVNRLRPTRLLLAAALLCVVPAAVVLATRPAAHLKATARQAIVFDQIVRHRVVDGSLRHGDQELRARGPVPMGTRVFSEQGATLALDNARVEARPGTSLTWRGRDATFELHEGSVIVDVASRPGKGFQVATERFTVEVVGTRFEVTLRGVRVERGVVFVRGGPKESVFVREGEHWTVPDTKEPRAEASEPAEPPVQVNASALLARARRALARGDVDGARRGIAAATRAQPTPQQAAEASTLLAECALVSGKQEEAAEGYAAVAEKYAGSAAGENALFAAGRLAATQGNRAEAVRLFRLYLSRYPKGKFIHEVRARLAALQSTEKEP